MRRSGVRIPLLAFFLCPENSLNAYAAPLIGTGMLMIFSVSGQLLCSILIQQFGWLGSTVKKIRPVQGLGLILILAGVVMAEML